MTYCGSGERRGQVVVDGPEPVAGVWPSCRGSVEPALLGTPLAYDDSDRLALTVAEVSAGRVAVWGDEWITYDSEWADVAHQQVELFWINLLKWLSPPEVTIATRASDDQLKIASRTARPREKARLGLIQFGG